LTRPCHDLARIDAGCTTFLHDVLAIDPDISDITAPSGEDE
jgi:hypothetical protein